MTANPYLIGRIFYGKQLGWHLGHHPSIKKYSAHPPQGFSLMNLLCIEPRRIFEAHVLEAEASALLQRLNSPAYPRIHHRHSGNSLILEDFNFGKQLIDLASSGAFLIHPPVIFGTLAALSGSEGPYFPM
jgi:hypothetical protein